jgi:hypothetical protein
MSSIVQNATFQAHWAPNAGRHVCTWSRLHWRGTGDSALRLRPVLDGCEPAGMMIGCTVP